jgi:hypothetical protein
MKLKVQIYFIPSVEMILKNRCARGIVVSVRPAWIGVIGIARDARSVNMGHPFLARLVILRNTRREWLMMVIKICGEKDCQIISISLRPVYVQILFED